MDKQIYRVKQPITVRVGVKSVGKKPGALVELTTHAARSLLSNGKVSQYVPPAATPAEKPEDVESKEEPKEPEDKEEAKEPAKKPTSRRRRKAKPEPTPEGDD